MADTIKVAPALLPDFCEILAKFLRWLSRAAAGKYGTAWTQACATQSVSVGLRFVVTYQTARDGDAWLALADRTRRAIVERLAHGPAAVGELARDLPVSRPAVSQHLKVLKCAGLVRDRAAGTRRVYQLDPTGLEAVRADLDRFWTQALANYATKFNRIEGDAS
jgi:DNA-binding transcriptional ArsR family regulator